jgi:RHS repeat-associated protein
MPRHEVELFNSEKGAGGVYSQIVYRPAGTKVGVYSGGLVKGTVPLPGGGTAVYNSGGLNFIRHKDWLGSSRLATTWAHAVYSKEAYAPFGETYNEAGTPDRSFTGQDQNVATGAAGSGVYDFLFRKYDPSAGRWLSPDPSGWNAVSQADPQSLNRYAYVENQPLSFVDPFGLTINPIGGGCFEDSGYTSVAISGDGSPDVNAWDLIWCGPDPNQPIPASFPYVPVENLPVHALSNGSNKSDQWPLNGNLLPGTHPQDGVCTTGPLSGPMNSDPLILSCCQAHDNCYAAHGCNATSWIPNPLPWGACNTCNLKAAACIMSALAPIFIP